MGGREREYEVIQSNGLNWIVDQYIFNRLILILEREQYTLIVQKKQQELLERKFALKLKKRREFFLKIKEYGELLNLWSFFVIISLLLLIGGITVGINIPDRIACNEFIYPLCDRLRFR